MQSNGKELYMSKNGVFINNADSDEDLINKYGMSEWTYANTFVECETVLVVSENKQYIIEEIKDDGNVFVVLDIEGNRKEVNRSDITKIRKLRDSGKTTLMRGIIDTMTTTAKLKIHTCEFSPNCDMK